MIINIHDGNRSPPKKYIGLIVVKYIKTPKYTMESTEGYSDVI